MPKVSAAMGRLASHAWYLDCNGNETIRKEDRLTLRALDDTEFAGVTI